MSMLQFRVISIGTLGSHPLWGEKGLAREAHATTTLIEAGDRKIIVDPSLPANILLPRMQSRTGVKCNEITDVFLTSKHPGNFRGITLFPEAQWWMAAADREVLAEVGEEVERLTEEDALRSSDSDDEDEGDTKKRSVIDFVKTSLEVSRRIKDAPDKLADGVDLFPLPGVTPGTAGLLLAIPSSTILITGDAIVTEEHLAQGRVTTPCESIEQAQESFREALEIADVFVLGRDNIVFNPMRGSFGRFMTQSQPT
ncbi:MAG: MBL fold metallo-hydrolase [Phycisphaerales bacterium]|nr:MBL fold metallo-hydrolase [Phycisphaerales bacterium]